MTCIILCEGELDHLADKDVLPALAAPSDYPSHFFNQLFAPP